MQAPAIPGWCIWLYCESPSPDTPIMYFPCQLGLIVCTVVHMIIICSLGMGVTCVRRAPQIWTRSHGRFVQFSSALLPQTIAFIEPHSHTMPS